MEESKEKKKQGVDRTYFSVQLFFLIFTCSVVLSLMAVTIFLHGDTLQQNRARTRNDDMSRKSLERKMTLGSREGAMSNQSMNETPLFFKSPRRPVLIAHLV